MHDRRTVLSLEGLEFIETAYAFALGRAADPGGLRNYAKQLQDGAPKDRILDELQASDEGRLHAERMTSSSLAAESPGSLERLLSLPDDEFVASAYRMLLGREADPSGRNNYLSELGRGVSRATVLRRLRLSQEGQARAAEIEGLDELLGEAQTVGERVRGLVRRLSQHVRQEAAGEVSSDGAAATGKRTGTDDNGPGSSSSRPVMLGKVDKIDTDGIAGWAFDEARPDAVLTVEVWDGGQFLLQASADRLREDVNRTFGIGGRHGYEITFPEHLYDGRAHAFRVLVDGQEIGRRKEMSEPVTLKRSDLLAVPPASRYEGCVEGVTSSHVHGWACDRKNPGRPVNVSVLVDGELIGTVTANRFSARLRSEWRDGHQVFLMKLPTRLMNGTKRNVKVVIAGTAHELKNAQSSVAFPLVDLFGQMPAAASAPDFSYVPPPRVWQSLPARASAPGAVAASAAAGVPVLSLIVLNWNGVHVLRQFLESLLRVRWHHAFEVLLVDHGSQDESVAVARSFADRLDLRVVERGANYSFSASNNFAAGMARGAYLAFVNNDLVMLHDCFERMLPHLDDAEVGAVGLRLLEPLKTGPGEWAYITHHLGVEFSTSAKLPDSDLRYYVPTEIGEHPHADLAATYDLPATTGALLVCRAADFHEVGGFHEGYVYGLEDVDLCLTLRRRLGRRVVTDTSAVALHNRSATRDAKLEASERGKRYSPRMHSDNRKLFIQRHGRPLRRTALASLVRGEGFWRSTPLRVVFVVTEAHLSTAAGDFYTALELAEAMRRLFGWEVMFATMGTWELTAADVVVVMCFDYKVAKIVDANPGVVTVAWIRNRVDEWVGSPYFGAYQLIFCSSRKGMRHIADHTGRSSILLPIAANARRFAPRPPVPRHASDLTFTGSNWRSPRDAVSWLDPGAIDFAIYGHHWDQLPDWKPYWRGAVPYTDLPDIYASARIVLDDSHPVTRNWNSLNSRVFDALACGRLVLTNCVEGAAELFDGALPTFRDREELHRQVMHYLARPQEREALASKLHREVLEHHTYDHRAHAFKTALAAFIDQSLRFSIKIGVPSLAECENWGDYHFALGLQRALRRQGHFARIDILPDWNSGLCASDDVVIVLRGLSAYQPQPTAINLMWLISHPDEVSVAECESYDHVFVASSSFAQRLSRRLGDKVSTLLQCTDPELFHPDPDRAVDVGDVIFVGNSRGQRRQAVQFALDAEIDFEVYGSLWENLLPASRLKAAHVPNAELRRHYSSAGVVLNDHWPDMRGEGFVSNRIFDAGACGAALLTDDMAACRELFGDALTYYDSPATLASGVERLLGDAQGRRARGERLSRLIREQHTFDHRAAEIIATATALAQPGSP